jgi:putative ATP-dependent endonuclease of OLD family
MQIEAIKISNFRCLRQVELSLSRLTGLVGGNNAGKSTILKAIELFF